MREFNYTSIPNELMNYELMNLISAIHEYKGKQELFIEAKGVFYAKKSQGEK